MKKYLNLFLISLLVWSCNPKNVEPAGEFEVATNQSKVYSGLTIKILSFFDNRCPQGAVCCCAGTINAEVAIESNSTNQKVEVCLGACPNILGFKKDIAITIDNRSYTLTLLDIIKKDNLIEPATVRLKIE